MAYVENASLEQGFAPVFSNTILPKLHEFEFERQALKRQAWRKVGLVAAAAAAVIGALFVFMGPEDGLFIMIAVAVGAAFFGFASMKSADGRWRALLAEAVMPDVCAHVGDMSYRASGDSFATGVMEEMRLLPSYDSKVLSSLLSGTHQGTEFEIVHAQMIKKRRNSNNSGRTSETVFEGLLFRVNLGRAAPGRIALMRDRGGFGNKLAETFSFGGTRSMPKVTFEDGPFEATFEVYADAPDAARTFLGEGRRAALLRIGSDYGRLVAGFDGQNFYMALRRSGGFIEIGSLNNAATELENCLHGVFGDIAMVRRVIEDLAAEAR